MPTIPYSVTPPAITSTIDADTIATLATALHDCLLDEAGWSRFLRLLLVATGADHANIAFRRRDAAMNDLVSFHEGIGPSPDLSDRYVRELYHSDPLPYHALEPQRLYTLDQLLDPADPAAAAFVSTFLAPAGLNYLRIVKACEPDGYSTWLTIARRDSDFTQSDEAMLRVVARLLAAAVRGLAVIEGARRLQSTYEAATARLQVGVTTLDAKAHILAADRTVELMFAADGPIGRGPDDRLLIHDPAARRALQQALRDAALGKTVPRAVRLSDAPRSDMLLVPVTDRPWSGRHTPVLTAYIHREGARADRIESLMEMFQLSRGEARLALALSRGRTLTEAAAEMGLTVNSARTYSKRIFQKTGTHRQADLVRTILTSTVALI